MRKKIERSGLFYVYMVRCKDGSYYTGYTHDIERRITEHNNGRGANYLKRKSPVELVYAKKYSYYQFALNAEKKIKKYTKNRKEELIRIYDRSIPKK